MRDQRSDLVVSHRVGVVGGMSPVSTVIEAFPRTLRAILQCLYMMSHEHSDMMRSVLSHAHPFQPGRCVLLASVRLSPRAIRVPLLVLTLIHALIITYLATLVLVFSVSSVLPDIR